MSLALKFPPRSYKWRRVNDRQQLDDVQTRELTLWSAPRRFPLFAAGCALAFDAAAPDASHVAPGLEDPGPRSAKSLECSQKADAQDLHGKPRKHFMRDCKQGA
jgi:hypothetical protein